MFPHTPFSNHSHPLLPNFVPPPQLGTSLRPTGFMLTILPLSSSSPFIFLTHQNPAVAVSCVSSCHLTAFVSNVPLHLPYLAPTAPFSFLLLSPSSYYPQTFSPNFIPSSPPPGSICPSSPSPPHLVLPVTDGFSSDALVTISFYSIKTNRNSVLINKLFYCKDHTCLDI